MGSVRAGAPEIGGAGLDVERGLWARYERRTRATAALHLAGSRAVMPGSGIVEVCGLGWFACAGCQAGLAAIDLLRRFAGVPFGCSSLSTIDTITRQWQRSEFPRVLPNRAFRSATSNRSSAIASACAAITASRSTKTAASPPPTSQAPRSTQPHRTNTRATTCGPLARAARIYQPAEQLQRIGVAILTMAFGADE